jgi:hypothetical protein
MVPPFVSPGPISFQFGGSSIEKERHGQARRKTAGGTMIKTGKSVRGLALLSAAVILLTFAAFAANKDSGIAAKSLAPGATWVVDKTTHLNRLSVAEGATITAPQGHSLTMTVDGVETPVRAGTYSGDVVLTPAQDIDVTFADMGTRQTYKYRVGVYVDNGAYVPEKSVPAAVAGGSVTNAVAETVKLASVGEKFNGIMVTGNSAYAIKNPTIRLTGNGKNDFNGVGAAIRAGGSSNVTIENANIKDTGAVRTAIWVGDDSVTTINNSEIEVNDGTLPKDYGWSWVKGGGGSSGDVMMEVPWMLGLRGNNRATLVVGNGTAYYNNTHVKAQAWGAMSTDAVREAKLYLTKCHVETVQHGYGAYADGNSLVYSSGTTFDVADYGLIMSGGSGVFADGSVVNSRRIGVMAHGGDRGTLTIDKGSIFNTEKAVIQLKSSSPTIVVDGAKLNSKSGIILQVMANDDPNKAGPGGGMGRGGPPDGGPGGPPEGGKYSTSDGNHDVDATFRNVTLQGDFVNSWTAQSGMNLTFENSTVTGAITTATAVHATGPKGEKLVMQEAPDLYYLIGEQAETSALTDGPNGANVSLNAGSKWVVNKTSYLTGLTVAEGATITAPQGYSLTMTVGGVGTAIRPGTYHGEIVLSVTKEIVVPFMGVDPYIFRTAVYIDNGTYVPEKSVTAAGGNGKVTNTSATDVSVTSKEEKFNGIVVTGNSTYSIVNPKIDMTGNGGNDFAGFGAAIMSTGNAKVTVDKAHITTRGAVRTAVFVGGNSSMTVNNSSIEVYNGTLPADYQFSIMPGKMMEVPYGLGFTGNVRATNLMDTGTVYYNNSHIKAQAWGALSSDGDGPTRMYATNSLIETVESGYGAYANGDSHDHFSHCTFNVADAGLIVGGNGSGTFTDGTVVNSRKFGVMMHQGTGGGTLTIDKGSVFNTKSTLIEVKDRGTNIVVDNAELHPGNGVILQTMENDDPIMKDMAKAHSPDMPGGGGPGGPTGGPPGGAPGGRPSFSGDVTATFKNVTLNGDIIHAMTGRGDMTVTFEKATITGAITTATAFPSTGKEPTRETYYLVGDVKNTFGPTAGKYGLRVSLDGNSRWVVDKTSYLTSLTVAEGATISAPKGFRLTITVDGGRTPMKAGTYTGKIELQVAPGA